MLHATLPVSNVMLALRPVEGMRVMINDGDTPGHNDIVTYIDCFVAYQVACTEVTTVANTDFAL
jgi:hypothetical protein